MIDSFLNAQSVSSLKALDSFFDLENLQKNVLKAFLIEDVLLKSSLLTRSSSAQINFVLNFLSHNIKNSMKNLKDKAILTLGSLIHLETTEKQQNISLINRALAEIIDLNKKELKSESNPESKLNYMEALFNSKHNMSIEYVKNLDKFKKSSKQTLAALKYMSGFNDNQVSSENVLKQLLVIFYNFENNKMISEESRIEALHILLEKFMQKINIIDSPILENIFRTLFIQKESLTTKEFRFYCQRLLLHKMNTNIDFK